MKKNILHLRFVVACCLLAVGIIVQASDNLRRPISNEQPAWLIHIDVWNYADPQKIIDMVPEDVRPYVIFNIATSSSDEKSPNGPNIYDSWMKVCAQNRVWTMIQCSSGATNRMPDTPNDVSAYEKYFKDYPNFLGFNFAEQYWGFDEEGGVTFESRLQLFDKLLSLAKAYGGYLAVSFADSYHNANKMPVAWMKRNASINTFLSNSPEHFLCFEKYTQKKNFLYNESHCLGAWLSGFAGQYGIRFDSSGWVESGVKPDMQEGDTQYTVGSSEFVRAAGAIPVAEHVMLTGQTIIDGPELSWTECSTEGSPSTDAEGFNCRNWQWTAQWSAITLDMFRKILDGTIRIPSKAEVMARTKVCVVSGSSGTDNDSYRIPAALYDGLYRNAADQGGLQGRDANHWLNNRWWMKSTGRYPAIPNMLAAGSLTDISSYVATRDEKIEYLNNLFPEEYTGDIFAGRHENGWVTYNPYQYDDVTDANGVRTLSKSAKRATGTIPFQYNTCTSLSLDYAPYSLGIIREQADRVTFYLQNFEGGTDIVKIEGANSQPTYTANGGSVTESWADNVYTLTVEHSGAAVELTVSCSGSATGRQTQYTTPAITTPAAPAAYTGVLQYEAELADYKSATIQKSGYGKGYDGYYGQGYAAMTSSSSALRYHVNVPEAGYYLLTMRYWGAAAGQLTASASGKDYTLTTAAVTEWAEAHTPVILTAGEQTIDLANSGGSAVSVDCIQLEKQNIAPFRYSTVNGEYHADFGYLTASGSVTFDAQTGLVSVPAGESGALTLLLDAADFRKVTGVELVRTSTDDDAFSYLRITDTDGNSVNPTGSQQAFWGSKYKLDYKNYQTAEASSRIYKLEWVANSAESVRTMTISDVVVTMDESMVTGIIDEADGMPAVVPASVTTADITYSRVLAAPTSDDADVTIDNHDAKLYTVCLPYKPATGNGLKYYTLSEVNDDTLVFEETTTVNANTPYLVSVTGDNQQIGSGTAVNVNFSASVADGTMHGGCQLRGTLRGLTNAEAKDYYILQTGNIWGRVPADTPSVYIPPFRAYIVATAGSQARLTSAVNSQPSNIRYIKTVDTDGTGTFYDLQGRCFVKSTGKGLYIHNGRKMIFNDK